MGEFFTPLRRKVGLLTLLIACVFAVGWVRSVGRFDNIIRLNAHDTHVVMSADGKIGWERMWPIAIQRPSRWMYRGGEWEEPGSPPEVDNLQWRFTGFGFDFRRITTIEGNTMTLLEIEYWQIPYWSIVIPLTLLSAWLLLSKPHKSTPENINELVFISVE